MMDVIQEESCFYYCRLPRSIYSHKIWPLVSTASTHESEPVTRTINITTMSTNKLSLRKLPKDPTP